MPATAGTVIEVVILSGVAVAKLSVWVVSSKSPVVFAVIETAFVPLALFLRILKVEAEPTSFCET